MGFPIESLSWNVTTGLTLSHQGDALRRYIPSRQVRNTLHDTDDGIRRARVLAVLAPSKPAEGGMVEQLGVQAMVPR